MAINMVTPNRAVDAPAFQKQELSGPLEPNLDADYFSTRKNSPVDAFTATRSLASSRVLP